MTATKVSGLLLTAIINIFLEIVCFALYSIFRKQPSNANIYLAARIQREKGSRHGSRSFAIDNYLPSSDWLKEAWKLSEDEIMKTAGLDSLVFIRIYMFCFRFFGACTIVGVFVLVPVNYLYEQIFDIDTITSATLDKFTVSNVTDGSERLWVHFGFLYAISFLAYILLYLEYKHIARRRVDYLHSAQPEPGQFTILVRAIPKSSQQTYSQQVDDFFCNYYPDTYLLQRSVYADTKWQKSLEEIQRVSREVQFLSLLPAKERTPQRNGLLGLSGRKEDPLNYYLSHLEELKNKFKKFQAKFVEVKQEIPAAFVSFRTRWGAAVAAQTRQTPKPSEWVTELAPEPGDVNWRSLSIWFSVLWVIRIVVGIIFVCITILYFVPAGLAYTLGTLENLKTLFPFATQILSIPVVGTLVNGYLPSLLLAILYLAVPSLMLFLTEFEGYPSISEQEIQTCGKVFLFLVTNSFFLVAYGSVLNLLDQVIESPRQIPSLLASAVTSQVNFFMNFVMTKGWTGYAIEILQPKVFFLGFFWRRVLRKRQYGPYAESLPYYKALPNLLLFIFIGFIYVIIAPLMLPFLMIYFFVGYIVFRNQILNRYEPTYETGGRYWPHIHNRIVFSVFMMQIIGIGMFGVKHKPLLSTLSVPLLPLTLLFHHYCSLRFRPVFEEMSMQVAVSKDMDEEKKGLREQIYRKLRMAYLYPALQPVDYNDQRDSSSHAPLLSGQQ
ncbi:hypothetical protein GOP47_0024780 [Adiantum capillus-veneris]|uniref:Uncharacterized protein n=1 Tax=Adiantum capillus-veneris TaxID=13818 RepID=A0A9D4U3H4_ADICA|nr:hypothetical protein GOP47_0024780 [Adiantum capillus-veneris]